MNHPIQCSLENTARITKLLSISSENRNQEWQSEFFAYLPNACFMAGDPQVTHGPDGFPYFELYYTPPGYSGNYYCIESILDTVLSQGLGISIHRQKGSAEWVLTYGDLLNYKLTQYFYQLPDIDPSPDYIASKELEQMMIVQPSEEFLPLETRDILRSYLNYLGIESPQMMGIIRSSDRTQQPQLVFNLFPEDFKTEEEYKFRLYQLGWFLPKHYIVVGLSKDDEAISSFIPL